MLPTLVTRGVVPPGYYALFTLDPLRGRRGMTLVRAGTPLGEALGDDDGGYKRAFIDDLLVSEWPHWRQIEPLPGSLVAVCSIPGPWIVPFIPYIIAAIVIAAAVASLVITLTAKQADRDSASRFDSPTLRGVRNRAAPHEPIPRIYGRYRIKPPLGAFAYTEVVGVDHYIRALFVIGYGPLAMDEADMRIGETPLSEFENVDIEVRQGFDNDAPLTLYPNQVTQEDLNITLMDPGMPSPDWIPGEAKGSTGWQVRNTDDNTDEVGIEILLPSGFGNISTKGQKQSLLLEWEIEYRATGSSIWIPVPQADLRVSQMVQVGGAGKFVVNGFRLGSTPIGINFKVPQREEYEIRVRATKPVDWIAEGATNTPLTESRWFALKSFRNEAPWNKKGIALIALRIKATDQLQGTIDDFSVIARALLPTWNGTAWTAPVETRNAAWAYADVLRGSANPDPVSDEHIDAERLLEWATINENHMVPDENGDPVSSPMYFDGVFDFRSTVYRTLADIAAVARGSPHMRDGRFSVMIDRDRSAEVPVQMISPRNIVKGTYLGRKVFFEEAHAYRIGFKNEAKDFGDDEVVVFTPGFNASNARIYEKLEWLGIIDAARAVDETRFMIAARRYRPEIHRFDMDIENLVAERGDLVLFAHDVPLLGLSYGRIKETLTNLGSVTGLVLDEKVVFQPGIDYGVRIRRHHSVLEVLDSVPVVNPATTVDVETSTFDLALPIVLADAPVAGDMVSFGELGIETRRCIVRSITPGADLVASVELEDEGAAIFGDLTEPMPPFDPGINKPADLAPFPPTIQSVTGDFVNILVTAQLRSGFGRAAARVEAQARTADTVPGQWIDFPAVPAAGLVTLVLTGLELDRPYEIRVRAVGGNGLASPWTQHGSPFFHASHPVDITRYAISDLRLDRFVVDPDQFIGPTPSFRWQVALVDAAAGSDPFSDVLAQAVVHESEIDRFEGYWVRVHEAVLDVDGHYQEGELLREELVPLGRYAYDYDLNVDDGGPRRAVFLEVAAQIGGLRTESSRKLAVNPVPELPAALSISGTFGTRIEIVLATTSPDADWEGFLVWISESAGFTPSDSNLIFRGRQDKVISIPTEIATTYYLRYASFDKFTDDPDALNVSDEIAITTASVRGSIDEVREVGCQKYDANPIRLALLPLFTPPNPSSYLGPHMAIVHELSFDVQYDGVVIATWDFSVFLRRISSGFNQQGVNAGIFYSIGDTPVGPADQIALTTRFVSDFPPLQIPGAPWPPTPDDQPALDQSFRVNLEVTAPSRVWFYCYYGWVGDGQQQHHLVSDALLIQEVLT